MDEGPRPRIGRIYPDNSPERQNAVKATWHQRDRLIEILTKQADAAFDQHEEFAARALLDVLEWHQPWIRWTQVFNPYYCGDRYEGAGCRTCGAWGKNDGPCLTVLAIAKRFQIE